MNRMLLVAFREFLENVRTKGFWLSILMMPIVLALLGFMPVLVENTRTVKNFAVVDETGVVLDTVRKEISVRDFQYLLTDFATGQENLLPDFLAAFFPEIRSLDKTERQSIIEFLFRDGELHDGLTSSLTSQLRQHRRAIIDWWAELSNEERAGFSDNISANYFRMIETSDLDRLNKMIESEELFAYFIIGHNIIEDINDAEYVSNNLTDRDLEIWFGELVSQYVRDQRLARSNIDAETADWLGEAIAFEGITLGGDGEAEEVDSTDIARQWAPVAFVYFLWISVMINTQMLITNTIEEKSNKLVEVLLSSVSAISLMGGKIIGIAATGLTIIIAWLTMVLAFFTGLPMLAGLELPIDLSSVMADPWFLGSFIIYFLLGYLFYAALLVGLGSLCNNQKEAQNLIMPVQLIQMVPIFLMIPIGRDPNGTLAQVLSYIPPLTPFVMMNRAAGTPSTHEYIATTILLLVSIVVAFWLAAKIFRVGILMTGKPPGVKEIFRLLRAPVTRAAQGSSE